MQISEAKRQVRLHDMAKRVQECQESGLPVSVWCEQNFVSQGSYYYWLKILRETTLDRLGECTTEEETSIIQVDLPKAEKSSDPTIHIHYHDLELEIPAGTGVEHIVSVLKAMKEAC